MQGTITETTRNRENYKATGRFKYDSNISEKKRRLNESLSVCLGPEQNGGAWTRLFFLFSLLLDIHISTWKRQRGLEPGWPPGTLGRGGSEPLVRPVVLGTSLGDIMRLCRMDDVTPSISGEGGEKRVKSRSDKVCCVCREFTSPWWSAGPQRVCVEECPCASEAPQSFLDQSSPAEMIEDPTGWMHRNRENDMQMG